MVSYAALYSKSLDCIILFRLELKISSRTNPKVYMKVFFRMIWKCFHLLFYLSGLIVKSQTLFSRKIFLLTKGSVFFFHSEDLWETSWAASGIMSLVAWAASSLRPKEIYEKLITACNSLFREVSWPSTTFISTLKAWEVL